MTPRTLTSEDDLSNLGVDTIIDVRAPVEFAEDHLPGAINLPVLNDEQRAEVGTIYAQSPFKARKIGGALVAQNTALHLQGPLADKMGDWQPLVYCWRGGQRSGAFATILGQVGWRVQLLQGGYRSYRRLIAQSLYETPLPHRLILIEGGTGTAKTELLHQLSKQGAQMLDLEGLAHHRGSLFGATDQPQPAQKMFESRLAAQLRRLDPHQITWVEAESSKIGGIILPPSLWMAMQTSPRVEVSAPLTARATYLCRTYGDLTQSRDVLAQRIDKLRPYHAGETIKNWQVLADAKEWPTLAAELIRSHYDPRYAKSADQAIAPKRRFELDDLTEATLTETAAQMIAAFS
ncbi:MAG: tRNA 2-selenouridine(34) synthase MnmH [Sulfitobacter sp.]